MIAPNRDPQILLADFFERVYLPLHPALRPGSVEQYRVALRHLERFAGQPLRIADLADDLVAGMMSAMLAKGLARGTANKTRAALVAIWRYAYRKKWTDDRPDVDKLRMPKHVPEAWTMGELERLLAACTTARGNVGQTPAWLFWHAFVLVVYDTGLRRTAALSIRMADVRDGNVTVQAEFQKHGMAQTFRLSPQTADVVREFVAADPDRELLFPWPFGIMHPFTLAFRKLLKAAGLAATRKDLIHKLRRTSATHLANVAGQSFVQAHLGHSHPSVTAGYIDPRQLSHSMRAADLLPRPTPAPVADAAPAILRRILEAERLTPRDLFAACAAMGVTKKEFAALAGVSERHFYELAGSNEPMSDTMQARFRGAILSRIEAPMVGQFDPLAELVAVLAERTLEPESIRRAIRALGMKQKAFAACVGFSEQYLCMVLGGNAKLTERMQRGIRAFLEAKAGWV